MKENKPNTQVNTENTEATKDANVNVPEEKKEGNFFDGILQFGKSAGKVLLIVGGVVLLGAIGLTVAGAVSASKKENEKEPEAINDEDEDENDPKEINVDDALMKAIADAGYEIKEKVEF